MNIIAGIIPSFYGINLMWLYMCFRCKYKYNESNQRNNVNIDHIMNLNDSQCYF